MTMTELETIPHGAGRRQTRSVGCLPALGVGVFLRKNPYSPGAGLRPAALVGRDSELQNWSLALQRLEKARSAKSVVLHGLRGEGRTVLLGEFDRMARERDWITVIIEANTVSPLRDTLVLSVASFDDGGVAVCEDVLS